MEFRERGNVKVYDKASVISHNIRCEGGESKDVYSKLLKRGGSVTKCYI
jgi:hypothetical protein